MGVVLERSGVAYSCLALVGDPDGLDVLEAIALGAKALGGSLYAQPDALQELEGIVFDPSAGVAGLIIIAIMIIIVVVISSSGICVTRGTITPGADTAAQTPPDGSPGGRRGDRR